MNPWEKYAATKPASGPWEGRSPASPPVIATTPDGGRVYRMPDNTLSFSSPGMSTNNQDAIRKIMEGATPAEGSVYGDVSEGGQIGAGVRSLIQGMMFGGGDEVVARGASLLPGGGSYEAELQRERARLDRGRDKSPVTSAIAEIGGAVAVPLGAIAPVQAATKLAPVIGNTGARVANALGTAAKSAAVTGGLSAAYGFGTGEGFQDRMQGAQDGAMFGAGVGAAIPVVGGIAERILNRIKANSAVRKAAANAPTTEELLAMGNARYKAVEDAGVVIAPDAMRNAADDVISRMTQQGMDVGEGSLTPQSMRVATIIDNAASSGQPMPFRELDLLRRKAGVPASNLANRGEAAVGSEAITALDDFVNNLTPAQVTQGQAADLPELINGARDVWAKMRRSQLIDDAIENADTYLGGAASGVRNQFARILRNPKLSRGFSEAERKMMLRVVNGSIPEQLLNLVSGGIGQLASVVGSTASGGVAGGLAGAAGAGVARTAAENVALRNAERVRAIIANGGLPALPQIGADTRATIDALMRRGTAVANQ